MSFNFTDAGTGAAAAVEAVFNAVWQIAQNRTDLTNERTDAALAYATNAPQLSSSPTVPGITVAPPPGVTAMSQAELMAIYGSTKDAVSASLANTFTAFLSTHFPVSTDIVAAQNWILRALTTGGSGINTSVEEQLWARDRARLMRDTDRAVDEASAAWAARGYPLPPGALVHQVSTLQRDLQDKLGESSRNAAITSFTAEVENARIAVERAISLRVAAVAAATEYMRALVLAPQLGAQLAETIASSQARLNDALTSFYRADVEGKTVALRVTTTNAELAQRTNEANLRALTESVSQRVQAAMSAAQMTGTQAAAALNALHANAAISGADVTNL